MVKEEKGQSLIEFALVLPLLLLLLVGIFDFGRIIYSYMHLHITAQETVRLGGLGRTDAEMTAFARQLNHLGNSNQLKVAVSPSDSTRRSGGYVTVTLEYPVNYVTPMLSRILPSPLMIKTDSTIRVE